MIEYPYLYYNNQNNRYNYNNYNNHNNNDNNNNQNNRYNYNNYNNHNNNDNNNNQNNYDNINNQNNRYIINTNTCYTGIYSHNTKIKQELADYIFDIKEHLSDATFKEILEKISLITP